MKPTKPLIALSILLLSGCRATTYTHGIPNFAVIEPGIYRGGWPSMEGWGWLRDNGVSNVVHLASYAAHGDMWSWGRQDSVWLPINCVDQTIGRPSSNLLALAVASIHPGTFVHCLHGQDRTGLVVAMWRVKACHWSKRSAEAEMLSYGFHPWLRGLYWAWEEDVPNDPVYLRYPEVHEEVKKFQ